MTDINVHTYEAAHKEQLIELIVGIQAQEYGVNITRAGQPDLEEIPSHYQHGLGNFWVAVHDNQVVGTIALLDIGNNQVALRKMFVAKDYRGAPWRVGAKLLDTALQTTSEQHPDREITIWLGTTSAFVAAHRFYEKNGFTEISKDTLPQGFPIMAIDSKFYRRTLDI